MMHQEDAKQNTQGLLLVFVYGTLKRGMWNHERFCSGSLSIEEAVVRGNLYEMDCGLPRSRCRRGISSPTGPPSRAPTWPHRRVSWRKWPNTPTCVAKAAHGADGALFAGN